jgi:hypothetical protein
MNSLTRQASDQPPEPEFEDGDVVVVAERRVVALGSSTLVLEVGTKLIVGSASFRAAEAAGVKIRAANSDVELRDIRAFQGRQAQDRADDARFAAAQPAPPKLAPIEVPSLAEAVQMLDDDPEALRAALGLLEAEEQRCHDGGLAYQSYYGVYEAARNVRGHPDKPLVLVALLTGAAELRAISSRGRIAADMALQQQSWSQVHAPAPVFDVGSLIRSLPPGALAVIEGRLAIRGRSGLHAQTLRQIEEHREVIIEYLTAYDFVL